MSLRSSESPLRSIPLALSALLLAWGAGIAPTAVADDGVAEINQTCATMTGCFSGDTPGWPVTIDGTAGAQLRAHE